MQSITGNDSLGPSPTTTEEFETYPGDIILRDGGVLDLGREHAIYLPCGYTIAVSEKLFAEARRDVIRSVRGLAGGHRRIAHDGPGKRQVCDPDHVVVVWTL